MPDACTLQLHAAGAWHDAASVSLLGPEVEGWKAKTYAGYAVEWAFAHAGATDAHALCAGWPVSLEPLQSPHWPVFVIDMLPQGYGRLELLRHIGQAPTAGVAADWKLLLAGAGNPIGNLRVKEAADWLTAQSGPLRGFTDDEVAERGDEFAEYLAAHGLFVAGSSGVVPIRRPAIPCSPSAIPTSCSGRSNRTTTVSSRAWLRGCGTKPLNQVGCGSRLLCRWPARNA